MTNSQFSRALAATLKRFFPALGTRREMSGADTIEELADLYHQAFRGRVPPPPAFREDAPAKKGVSRMASQLAAARWANATEADREQMRANGRKGGRPKQA